MTTYLKRYIKYYLILCGSIFLSTPAISQSIVPHRDIQAVDSLNRGKPTAAPVTVIKKGYVPITRLDGYSYWEHLGRYLQDSLGVTLNQTDSVFIMGDSICGISLGDTICVSQDSSYLTDSTYCLIQLGDTICIEFDGFPGSGGDHWFNADLTQTGDRSHDGGFYDTELINQANFTLNSVGDSKKILLEHSPTESINRTYLDMGDSEFSFGLDHGVTQAYSVANTTEIGLYHSDGEYSIGGFFYPPPTDNTLRTVTALNVSGNIRKTQALIPSDTFDLIATKYDLLQPGISDSFFISGDSICIIDLVGDTLCLSQDSFYMTDSTLCYILLGDTICISNSSQGTNIYLADGTISDPTRTVYLPEGTSLRYRHQDETGVWANALKIPAGGSGLGVIMSPKLNNQTYPVLRLENSLTSGGNVFIHFDGETADPIIRDYTIGLDKVNERLTIGEGAYLSNPMMEFYGGGDSIVAAKDIHITEGLIDYDGDYGTTGQLLSSTGTQVDWIDAPSGGGGAISDLTVATGTNTIDNGAYQQEWQWNTLGSTSGLKLSSTSTAAASNTQKLFESTLSGANGTSTQSTYAGYFSNAHTGTSSTNYGVYGTATGGSTNYGLYGSGTYGVYGGGTAYGVYGNATTYGVYGNGTTYGVYGSGGVFGGYFLGGSGTGVTAATTSGLPINISMTSGSNNGITKMVAIGKGTSGTAATGIGASIDFTIETDGGSTGTSNQLITQWTDATDASRTSSFSITGVNSATTNSLLTLSGPGQLTLDQYTTSNFNGGVASDSVLVVTSAGVVKKRNTASFGGDDWGADVVNTDLTLTGDGTVGNVLKVDTSEIATQYDLTGYVNAGGRSGGQTIIGGTGTTDDLTLQTTSGVGASGADMHFLVGNNGATEAMTILNDGSVGIMETSPLTALEIFNNKTGTADLPGGVSSQKTALTIYSDATQTTSRPGIVQYGLRSNSAGMQYDINSAFVGTSTANVQRATTMGVYADVSTDGSHTNYYTFIGAETTTAYNDATLKVDADDRVGIALSGITRPATSLEVGGLIKGQGYTVATLPTGVTGATAYVTDASGPTYLATVVGGGAVTCPVFYNGSNWVCH